jgi:EAL domain-containing protein (putative c-di-GMP-specific phosphodiesterase class I)
MCGFRAVMGKGVETDEQAKIFRLAGCDLIQGFLFSKALPFDELKTWRDGRQKKPHLVA